MVKVIAWIVMSIGIIVLGSSMMTSGEHESMDTRTFNESADLALRQMGHELLQFCGDNTSSIGSVINDNNQRFRIMLPVHYDYDELPRILDGALAAYGIGKDYQVAIRDCETENLVLGYNVVAYENGNVACQGRPIELECSWVSVTFIDEVTSKASMSYSGAGLLLCGLLLLGFSKRGREVVTPIEPMPQEEEPEEDDSIVLGASRFNHTTQKLSFNGETKELTYRESKLLQFLATHQQEVLDRETLVSEVWGSEGVIVGRSLDVFISRLRKILRPDPQLEIKNIHGVGYKLIIHDLVSDVI